MNTDIFAQSASPVLTDNDPLFHRCMDPYRGKNCIYLTAAQVDPCGSPSPTGSPSPIGRGTFRIDESCYIDDTGHFNAAEFVISYNQLMYMTLAQTVACGTHPVFSGWTIDDYWQRQLPNILIQQLDSRYSRPINARSYHATFTVTDYDYSRLDRGILKMATTIEFADDNDGRARGSVLLALTNLPHAGLESARQAMDTLGTHNG